MQRSLVRPSPVFLGILAVTIVGGVLAGLGDELDGAMVTTGTVLLVLGGWGVSLCLHEFGHAMVAYRGGDREVYFKGYLTLDPRRYTDPVLSLLLPLIFLAIGGIPLPGGAVWINHYALRSKRVESMVSLAGPLSNLVIGVLLIISVEVFQPSPGLASALSFLALLQILAFVLNILPIPGLDGWGAIEPYLSPEAQRFGAKARPWAPLLLFALLIGVRPVGQAFFDVSDSLFDVLGGYSVFAAIGQEIFFFWQR
ncbi:MAG TPA: site-2 protease family protein [Actinophytocola sp.]|uniref:site-2 protease family protein n=1 Tax=Actinophytocola sp. TaxID=1872138 RepID=UPI002DDD5344|nr:site-2 protease family protein [Actinophytocola sp.]HEV2781353.1 site-2 protease family protein [Actinophytocola sp.]